MHSKHALLFSCVDINECVEAAMNNQQICNMTQSCENTLGSVQCICPGGTQLNMQVEKDKKCRESNPGLLRAGILTTILSRTTASHIVHKETFPIECMLIPLTMQLHTVVCDVIWKKMHGHNFHAKYCIL